MIIALIVGDPVGDVEVIILQVQAKQIESSFNGAISDHTVVLKVVIRPAGKRVALQRGEVIDGQDQ